jgi:4-hydroxy-tetrahydrodipicolinate synthase
MRGADFLTIFSKANQTMKSPLEIHGIYVPMITPLTEDEEIDVAGTRRLVEFIIRGGCQGLWVLGATGQFHTLTERQRDLLTATVAETAQGRVRILVGCMEMGPGRAIEDARRAVACGADGIFSTAPIFDPITQNEVKTHFRRIRQAVDLPLIAYNAEYSTQTPLHVETVRALAEEQTLVGLKDSADFGEFRKLVIALRDQPSFGLLTGHAFLADAAVLMGAHGCVPTYGNLLPATYAKLYECARNGDWQQASSLQNEAVQAARLLDAWGDDSIFGAFLGSSKTLLHIQGIISSPVSGAPYARATQSQTDRIRAVLNDLPVLKAQYEEYRRAG